MRAMRAFWVCCRVATVAWASASWLLNSAIVFCVLPCGDRQLFAYFGGGRCVVPGRLVAFLDPGLQLLDGFFVGAGCCVEVGGELVDFTVLMSRFITPCFFDDGVLGSGGAHGFLPDSSSEAQGLLGDGRRGRRDLESGIVAWGAPFL